MPDAGLAPPNFPHKEQGEAIPRLCLNLTNVNQKVCKKRFKTYILGKIPSNSS